MKKNVASQVIGAQLVSASDGSAITSGTVTVSVTGDGGTQAAGGGTVTHEGNGTYSYVPTQAETNYEHVMFTFTHASAVPVMVQVYTSFNVNDKTGFSLSAAGIQAIWDALTSALTTVGSVGKLLVDNVNATISSRSSHAAADVWTVGTRTLTSFGTLVADIWAYSTRTLTAFSTGLAVAVWDVLESAVVTASSMGVKVKTNLDAAISSRSTFDAGTTPVDLATDSVDNVSLAASAVDEIHDEVVEGSYTFRQLVRLMASALLGKASGLATTTAVYRDLGDAKDRITATVDVDGNRTAVTLDGT